MVQRAYRGRSPSSPMDAASVIEVIDVLARHGAAAWLDGGWGVDALLGRQTREHDDLDLVVELRHSERVVELLAGLGYELVAGGVPGSFVLVDVRGRQVDVHPVVFDADGNGLYRTDDGGEWVYPAGGFVGRGSVDGHRTRCLSPETQVLVHAGYELGDKDFLELYLLRERFGVEVPEDLLERVLEAGARSSLTRP